MPTFINSTNMNLPIPVVGEDPGPQWASNINSSLTIIDSHTHAAGSGVQITPDAININADLPANNFNITTVRTVRFTEQNAVLTDPEDLNSIYDVDGDLYYNDGDGNQVRITQSGAVAGSPGSISNLVAPASASYVAASTKFVWQSDSNVAASLDCRSIILRNSSASSYGMTMNPPSGMAANFSVTWPALPASSKFMSMDSSGNIGASWAVDNSTLEVSSNTVQVKDSGIVTSKIADAAVSYQKLGTINYIVSSSCGAFFAVTPQDVTNLSVSITTTGRPVEIRLIADGTSNAAQVGLADNDGDVSGSIRFYRDATTIGFQGFESFLTGPTVTDVRIPSSSFSHVDVVAAGTYTYTIGVTMASGATIIVNYTKLFVREM